MGNDVNKKIVIYERVGVSQKSKQGVKREGEAE